MGAKIRKIERENRALEKNNQLFMNSTSGVDKFLKNKSESGKYEALDKSILNQIIGHKVIPIFLFVSGPEYQEKLKLEEELRAAEDTLKLKKRHLHELQQDSEVSPVQGRCWADDVERCNN